jgi:flagellar FliJ protein
MRHHYQFMDRLTHAIGLQQGVLANALDKTDDAKKLVLEAEFRLTSLKQVLKKKQVTLAVCQYRREQKQTDEFAASRGSQALATYFSGDR